MLKQLLCNHSYKIIKELAFQSEAEKVKSMGYKVTNWNSLKRTYVVYRKCSICKKVKIDKYFI